MKLSIGELTILIDSIGPTRHPPFPPELVKIQKRLEKNRRKKMKKYADMPLRSCYD